MFGAILDREIVFLDHKKMDSKTSQNLHFSKGVSPLLLSKILIFWSRFR